MVMEIIVGAIALAFAILVIFLCVALRDARRTIKKTDKILTDIHKTLETLTEPTTHLVHNLDKLALDLKKKSEGLEVLFHPLYAMHKKEKKGNEKISEILECVADAISLFQKIKNELIT